MSCRWQVNGIFSYFGATPIEVTPSEHARPAGLLAAPDLVQVLPIYLDTGDVDAHLPQIQAPMSGGRNLNAVRCVVKPITNVYASISRTEIRRAF